jgi:hypothetical protein
MDPAPWIKFQQRNKVRIIGSFENEYGERYVIWCNENGDTPYFTGDEVEWEPKHRLWPSPDFKFSDEERDRVAVILWRLMDDLSPANASRLAKVNYSPELEATDAMIGWRKFNNVPALSWDPRHPEGD